MSASTLIKNLSFCLTLLLIFVLSSNPCQAQSKVKKKIKVVPAWIKKQIASKRRQTKPRSLNIAAGKQQPSVASIIKVEPAHVKIEQELNKPITVDFKDTPMEDVRLYLEKQHQINIIFDPRGLAEGEIDPDEPITFHAKDMKLSNVLYHMFPQFALTYFISHGALVITTETLADEGLTTVVYDIRKLTAAGIFEADLIKVVKYSLTDGLWQDDNDNDYVDGGVITPLPGCFVIRQTYAAHQQIRDMFLKIEHLIDPKKSTNNKKKKVKRNYIKGVDSRSFSKPLNIVAAQRAADVSGKLKSSSANRKIEKALQQEVTVEFNDTALKDFYTSLKTKYHIKKVILDKKAKEWSDITIDFSAQNMKLSNVLKHVHDSDYISYYPKNGSLYILDRESERKIVSIVNYNVRKLTVAGIDTKVLQQIIYNSADCGWKYNRSGDGIITRRPGSLIIKQSYQSHKKILNLLQQLEIMIDRKLP